MKLNNYREVGWNIRQALHEARCGDQSFRECQTWSWWTDKENEVWTDSLTTLIEQTETLLAELRAARAVVAPKEAKRAA